MKTRKVPKKVPKKDEAWVWRRVFWRNYGGLAHVVTSLDFSWHPCGSLNPYQDSVYRASWRELKDRRGVRICSRCAEALRTSGWGLFLLAPRYGAAAVVHELKTLGEPFLMVARRFMTAEFRRDNRVPRFAAGHRVALREWSPDRGAYTGSTIVALITDVRRGADSGVPKGFALLSLGDVQGPFTLRHKKDDPNSPLYRGAVVSVPQSGNRPPSRNKSR